MTAEERREISAFLLRLNHASDEGRAELSAIMAEMDAGEKTPLSTIKETSRDG